MSGVKGAAGVCAIWRHWKQKYVGGGTQETAYWVTGHAQLTLEPVVRSGNFLAFRL